MTKQTGRALSQLLGVYQLAVGVIGLIFLLYSAYLTFRINLFFFLYYSLMIGMLALCCYAGYKCLTQTVVGLKLTLFNQFLQFVSFTLIGFNYYYSAGLGFYVGVDVAEATKLITEFKLFKIEMGKADPQLKIFLINLIPIIIVFLIEPITKTLQKADD